MRNGKNTLLEKLFVGNKMMTATEGIGFLASEYRMPSFLWNKVFRLTSYRSVKFSKNIMMLEDYLMMPQLFDSCNKILYIDRAFYYYRQIDSSITHNINLELLKSNHDIVKARENFIFSQYPELNEEIRIGRAFRGITYLNIYNTYCDSELRKYWLNDIRNNIGIFIKSNGISLKFKVMALLIDINFGFYLMVRAFMRNLNIKLR